jgi:cytoskeletal protein RodZ
MRLLPILRLWRRARRVRISTWVLTAVFVLALGTYVVVRPPQLRTVSTTQTTVPASSATEPAPATSSPTSKPTPKKSKPKSSASPTATPSPDSSPTASPSATVNPVPSTAGSP